MDFIALAERCAPSVSPQTMAAIVKVESNYNPYAIGVVNGQLQHQPRSLPEAMATVQMLRDKGYNFSVGLAQVNRYNFNKYGLNDENAFNVCDNLRAGSEILTHCYTRALEKHSSDTQTSLRAAFSCYYSGNFLRGFTPDKIGQLSYVDKVVSQANHKPKSVIVPEIEVTYHAEQAISIKQTNNEVTPSKQPMQQPITSKKIEARLDQGRFNQIQPESHSINGQLRKIKD